MKKFNLNRFWQVFKRLMLVRSSTTLYTFLGLHSTGFYFAFHHEADDKW